MGLRVEICGGDNKSDEYQAAYKLKQIIRRDMPSYVEGEIVLFSSATLIGQAVKDIDLLMLGMLKNYKVDATFLDLNSKTISDKVEIVSFCTTIEIKSHDISGIFVNGTDFYVSYGQRRHCVTNQSNKQKIAAKNFFERTISFSPYITNLIWFTQASSKDINELLTNRGKRMPSNVLGADFSFKDLARLLIAQKTPMIIRNRYVFDSNYCGSNVSNIKNALDLFSTTKRQMRELTRRRIEQITNDTFGGKGLINSEGKVSIYRGRAGTGKTVELIQTAIRLVDEMQARVLMLTYNKVLVSDIRRLFALAELPDMFEEKCVNISTMHSFSYCLINRTLFDGKMPGDRFLSNYDKITAEFLGFLNDNDATELIKDTFKNDLKLNWDYLLIDEAQDWTNNEKDIILKLYDKGRIIVADGGLQFVRNIDSCDWSLVKERNNIKLKYCLRQKENLITFLNAYSEKNNILGGKILTQNNMLGGRVIVTNDEHLLQMHHQEMIKLKSEGNIAYDMLYLMPYTLIKKEYGYSLFSMKELFEKNSISVWDGTSDINRNNYPIYGDEIRVLQYESARGLEGWTVVCMDFDVFLEEKAKNYVDNQGESLLLESSEERRRKYIYNWAMIPLTRAIDTLIITIKDEESDVGKMLKSIREQYPDFVHWI